MSCQGYKVGGGRSTTFHWNKCNKSLQTVGNWGRALSCRKITSLDNRPRRLFLIAVFIFCKVVQAALRMFKCMHITFKSPCFHVGSQLTTTYRRYHLLSLHSEPSFASFTAFCFFKHKKHTLSKASLSFGRLLCSSIIRGLWYNHLYFESLGVCIFMFLKDSLFYFFAYVFYRNTNQKSATRLHTVNL